MATLNLQVGAGADDAVHYGSSKQYNGFDDTDIYDDADTGSNNWRMGGSRWQVPSIASGDTVDAASVQIYVEANDDMRADWYCEAVDDAAAFATGGVDDMINRPATASVNWTEDGLGAGWDTTPSLVTPVQAVIDRGGWAAGNHIVIMAKPPGIGTKFCRTTAYDDDNTRAWKLDIDYSAGGPSAITSQRLKIGTGR